MKKRLLSLSLALMIVASLFATSALAAPSETEMIQTVNALGIMVGDEKGNMNLGAQVTRAEFTTMAVKATPGGDRVGQAASSPYPDVPYHHWASGYVEAGIKLDYISGYTDGKFRPNNQITLAEGVSIVLKVLGYSAQDFTGIYPSGQMALYRSLKLDEGMSAQNANTPLTRRDCMILFYNMLTAPTKAGQPYLTTLGHSLNSAGEVDIVALVSSCMKGPVIATGNWQSQIAMDLNSAKVYRGKNTVSLSQIQEYEVVYWSDTMRSLWVYNDRVTGTIQAISPSQTNPVSVTVAGKTYTIESSAVAYAFSTMGSYDLGDQVTLLLGKDGEVAGVADIAAASSDKIGVVTAVTQDGYNDPSGNYMADTVTILATDGKTYSYPWYQSSLKEGNLVQIQVSDSGKITLTKLTNKGLSGKVSSDGSSLGNYTIASDVEIMDTYEGNGLRVYPSRLTGVSLASRDVRYYEVNARGEISRLVLDDFTGDLHQYGILAELTEIDIPGSTALSGYYGLLLEGQPMTVATSGTLYAARKGPVQIVGSVSKPDKISSLTEVKIDRVAGNLVYSGSRSYTLSDTVQVYQYLNGSYQLSNLTRVQELDCKLTAYYDKAESDGGLIRIIVAR